MPKLNDDLKFDLYCEFVQDPAYEIKLLSNIYKKHRKKNPISLKEDFCGNFFLSTTWVKSDTARKAVAVDIDGHPLQDGYTKFYNQLNSDQQKRLTVLQADVTTTKKSGVDINYACNFSYNCLKKRSDLLSYFKSVYTSLDKNGIFVLDNLGGSDTLYPYRDRRSSRCRGEKWFYFWELKNFNPNTQEAKYAIHFSKHKDKVQFRDVYTYDWRMWSVAELTDLFLEAGFKSVKYYWENDKDNYVESPKGDLGLSSWVVYLVALK